MLGVLIVILICGAMFVGVRSLAGPSEGTISKTTRLTTDPAVKPRLAITNSNAQFNVHSDFIQTSTSKLVGNEIQLYNFTRQRTAGSWNISIRIFRLDGQLLQSEGSYNFRNVTSDRFTKAERTIGLNKVTVFTDNLDTAFNKTAYLTNVGLAASVTLMGGAAGDFSPVQAEFDDLIMSWRWK